MDRHPLVARSPRSAPRLSTPGAVEAARQRGAQELDCPADWQPLSPNDGREGCYGGGGKTSSFGDGLVDTWAATD